MNNSKIVKSNEIEFEIINYFGSLHSRLQVLEQQMLNKVNKAKAARLDSLNRLNMELESNIGIMRPIVGTGNMIINTDAKHLDKILVSELRKNIEMNFILPCELSKENSNETINDDIKFIVDETFMNKIESHCKIKFEEGQFFKLTPVTDFNERNFSNEDTAISSSDNESILSKSEVLDSIEDSSIFYVQEGCKTRVSLAKNMPVLYGNVTKPEKLKNDDSPAVFVKGTVEQVTVTHINSPTNFYIQLYRLKNKIAKLTDEYGLYAEHVKPLTEPETGKTYIVEYKTGNSSKWYRGLLKNIVSEKTTVYEIFFIDYGNTVAVPISKIRPMKPIFMQDPPFAYRCRLSGIIAHKNDWNDDVLTHMVQFITSNSSLKMRVVENGKGFLDIELFTQSSSLNQYLIFLGCARHCNSSTSRLTKKKVFIDSDTKILSGIDYYKCNESYEICISHIINPHNIYIQLTENMPIILNLEIALTRYYNKKENRKMIFNPTRDIFCAAKLTSSKDNWWRVKVTDIPGNGNVEVFAVDYGITEIMPCSNLCILRDIHRRTDAQAIAVSLKNIAPPKDSSDEWPEETNEYLRHYLKNKTLTIYVHKPSKTKLEVSIYERTKETDICIDALLVRQNLAESTGESSLLVEFYKRIPNDNDIKDTHIFNHLITTEKKTMAEKQTKMIYGNSYYVRVNILKINSPGSFYVDILKWQDEKITMHNQMYKFYSKIVSLAKKWKLNDKCVIRSKDDKYYRAVIIKVLDDDEYEVFLKDFVRYERVFTRNLYEVDIIFTTNDYVFHCCLGGIKPTGGLDKWSAKSTEEFQDFVEQNNLLYITKYGLINQDDKILPVQLLTSKHEKIEALELPKYEVIILNDELIDKGLAFPNKVNIEMKEKESVSTTLPKIELKSTHEATLYQEQNFLTIFETDNSFSMTNIPTVTICEPTSWLSPNKLTESQFKAYPSYVDFEGNIYFHTEKAKNLFMNVKRILNQHFKNSHPEPHQLWQERQMVSVRYHLDKCFYRGIIIETRGDGKILVQFIDFGNQEEVTQNDLRSKVLATDIPTLAQKCKLSNIHSGFKWTLHSLDRLHLTLVDQEVQLFIDEETIHNEIPEATIYVQNECVNVLINNLEWNDDENKKQSSDDDKSVIIEEEIENQDMDIEIANTTMDSIALYHEKLNNSDLKYHYIPLPEKRNFQAIVINLLDYQTVLLEGLFAADLMTNTKDHFETMSNEINESASELCEISTMVGLPCIALFSMDKKWYRAEILNIDPTGYEIKVLFVDYGNIEIVPKENVKVIKSEWLEFPVSMIKCKLWGIQKGLLSDISKIYETMKKTIIDKTVICYIQSYSPELEVKLIDEDTYDLIYKPLLDNEMIENSK